MNTTFKISILYFIIARQLIRLMFCYETSYNRTRMSPIDGCCQLGKGLRADRLFGNRTYRRKYIENKTFCHLFKKFILYATIG